MKTFKVTVCRFGHAIVMAESESEAKEKVNGFTVEQIHWLGDEGQKPTFLVTYAESQMDADNIDCGETRRVVQLHGETASAGELSENAGWET